MADGGYTVSLSDAWIDGIKAQTNDSKDLRHLYSRGLWTTFLGTIVPPAGNRCAYCGRAPVQCPECGTTDVPCPSCGGWPFAAVGSATPEQVAAGVILHDPDASRGVIDPRRWDGSDWLPSCVTRRTVDFLLSIHLWPFVAAPLPTWWKG